MNRILVSNHLQCRPWTVMLTCLLMLLVGRATDGTTEEARRLAILVAAPWEGETAMHNDLVATYIALRQRGFLPEEVFVLEGLLTRSLLLAFLHEVHTQIAAWQREPSLQILGNGATMLPGTPGNAEAAHE